jgi:hypothetical protein
MRTMEPKADSKIRLETPRGTLSVEGSEEFVRELAAKLREDDSVKSDNDLLIETGLKHAWDWFELHANQRMQAVNFFLVATAFLCAAYVTALNYSRNAVALGVSLVGIAFSIFFAVLEARVRELVKSGERAIIPAQRILASRTSVAELTICDFVEKPSHRTKYSTAISALHYCAISAFTLGFAYALLLAFPVWRQKVAAFAVVSLERLGLIVAAMLLASFAVVLVKTANDAGLKLVRYGFAGVFALASVVTVLVLAWRS